MRRRGGDGRACLRTAAARDAHGRDAAAGDRLSLAEQDGLRELAALAGPLAARAAPGRRLVHCDYNPKNLLAVRQDGRRTVTAVLDWEFAFSGSPLTDIGNMLRPRPAAQAGLAAGFIAGYREAGGRLPADWREISEALDLYALADFLTRPPDHRYRRQAVKLIRARLARA
jgi:aminoglycoside phosphotransferase (APT) family kinase protein